VAVVQVLKEMGSQAGDGRPLSLDDAKDSSRDERATLRLVVFLTDQKSGKVLAVTEKQITR
jgi:hypothetical protein